MNDNDYVAKPHGLGPHAVEIKSEDLFSAWVLVGNMVYFSQPTEQNSDAGLTTLSRSAAIKLAELILAACA